MYKFSVSGLRGKVFVNLFPYDCFLFSYLFAKKQKEKIILLGYDTRPTLTYLLPAVISGIFQANKHIIVCKEIPTPTIVFASKISHLPAIMLTASHNPIDENGLKFISPLGRFLFESEIPQYFKFKKIENQESQKKLMFSSFDKEDLYHQHFQAIRKYKIFKKFSFKQMRVGFDCCNGAASDEIFSFASFLNLESEFLYCEKQINYGFPRPPEPNETSLKKLANLVKKQRLDLGVGFDPDGDRVAFVCENGKILNEEYTLPLALLYFLKREKTSVVCNFSTSLMVDDVCEKFGVPLFRTKVGESNVCEKMLKSNSLIGGEGNGGVIVKDINFTRDGFVAIYLILSLMKEEDKPLSILKKNFNEYIIIKKKFSFKNGSFFKIKEKIKKGLKKLFKNDYLINEEDGFFFYKRNLLFHLRKSNTEDVLRLIINTDNEKNLTKIYEILDELNLKCVA